MIVPSITYGSCGVYDVLTSIRPGAEWVARGNSYAGIEWLDKAQAMPTLLEVQAAITACQSNATNTTTDNSVLANPLSTTDQKVNSLINLLKVKNIVPATSAVQVTP